MIPYKSSCTLRRYFPARAPNYRLRRKERGIISGPTRESGRGVCGWVLFRLYEIGSSETMRDAIWNIDGFQ